MTPDEGRAGCVEHIAWTAYGPDDPERTPVLLLHGITDSGDCWPAVVDRLAVDRLVVTPDARGHGGSGLPDEPFTIAALAAEVTAVVREVIGRPVLVVGHSMGGLTAEELALTEPDLVAGVVLEDPAWRRDRETTPSGAPVWLPETLADAARCTVAELEAASRADHPHWPEDEHAPWAAALAGLDQRLGEVTFDWTERDWVEALADVRVPVTLVTGDPALEAIVDEAQVARVGELLGRAPDGLLTHVHIPGTGHSIRRDDRPAFLRALDEALDRLE